MSVRLKEYVLKLVLILRVLMNVNVIKDMKAEDVDVLVRRMMRNIVHCVCLNEATMLRVIHVHLNLRKCS